ncbi:MAG: hypothetical protein IKO49_07375 [Bacilli bacterium]|nr:hypothetical protein [Bacilli bacterium]
MYNNPFLYSNPTSFSKLGLLKSLKTINWSTFLGNAQKTLGVINQAIPIVYQVKPIMQNAKTIFKIANTLKKADNNNINTIKEDVSNTNYSYNDNKPIFFL